MGISISEMTKRLRNGEKVVCSLCGKGIVLPMYTDDYKSAKAFECNNCGKILSVKLAKDNNNFGI